jgi:hypothetical protein
MGSARSVRHRSQQQRIDGRRAQSLWAIALISVLVIAGCSSGSNSSKSGGSTTSASAGEASEADAPARDGFADSSWPYPYSDLWRSSAAEGAGLPSDIASEDLHAVSVEVPNLPFYGVTDEAGDLFVLGGSPFLLNLFTEAAAGDPPENKDTAISEAIAGYSESKVSPAYVARIDAKTMEVTTVELPAGQSVNYIGGVLAHENGKIYAVATSTLFEIDPESAEITRSLDLPLLQSNPEFTSYNGLQVNPRNGDIIVKASDFAGGTTASLTSVDVDTLEIRATTETDVGTSRMTMVSQGDTEYLYIPGATTTQRYVVTDDGFDLDEAWSKTYRSDGDGSVQATAMLFLDVADSLVFADNDTIIYGVTSPLRIFTQSASSTTSEVTSEQAVSTDQPGGTFYMVAGDPFDSGIVIAQDAVNDILAGWQVSEGGALTKIWETGDYATSAGPAIAVDQGQLYVDDLRCAPAGSPCRNYLVVLDLATGDKIAEVEVAGEVASIGKIFLGDDSAYFISSEQGAGRGFVTKVDVSSGD